MSAEGEKAKETGTLPSAASAKPRGKRRASFAAQEEQATAKVPKVEFQFADNTEDEILRYLDHLKNQGDVEGLKTAEDELKELAVGGQKTKGARTFFFDLSLKASNYRVGLSYQPVTETSSNLGSGIRSLGLGSSAGNPANKEKVDAVLTSYKSDDTDRKGAMLAHSFYRSFLRHIYSTAKDERQDELERAKQHFQESLELIWKKTKCGVVKYKNRNDSTPEPPATSLLAADINQLISKIVDICKKSVTETAEDDDTPQIQRTFIKWASEYTLHHIEDEDADAKADADAAADETTGARKKQQPKCPRTDGLLVAADPNNDNALRALVSMEAKLDTFDLDATYQNRSNAIDAYSLQEPKDSVRPWPLLLFRYTLRHDADDSVNILAFVPTTRVSGKVVSLWRSSREDAIYRSIVAAVRTTSEFIREVHRKGKTPDFCSVHGNVVLDQEQKMVYKCFFNTGRRRPNLELIRGFVDPYAQQISLGGESCYVKMQWVGHILTDKNTCSMLAFLQIARELQRLHELGYCHGDIRVSNLILHPEGSDKKAKLVDFDLAGKTGGHKYPYNLLDLVDGARHVDIQEAIESKQIGDKTLEEKHDWFSLAAAMRCFVTKDTESRATWGSLIEKVENSISGGFKDEGLNNEDLWQEVQLKESVMTQSQATGSPKMGR